jgi:hypothetical protein
MLHVVLRLEEIAKWRLPQSIHFTNYYRDDQVKKDEIGAVCSAHCGGRTFLIGKREIERSSSRWKNNIKKGLR